MESLDYKNVSFISWDVGGRDKIVSLSIMGSRSYMNIEVFRNKFCHLSYQWNTNYKTGKRIFYPCKFII